ncbi:lipid phosphate phosphatase 2 isoform X2 [Cryptomeria japonica]|uniref:lipid phosphate phosphatase 2 isoform X2 n=1 Tax=Cryptomeria japonica TaxID=3369 RepID=UPI0027DA95E3|nr:lipid phosphate phosphatase 2 isoform X2 [Cryptomeria japonica]
MLPPFIGMRGGQGCVLDTPRSLAVQLIRFHKHDWLMILILLASIGILNLIDPFYRFVGKTMLNDLMYPLKENTVPFWAIPILAVVVPSIVFCIYYFYQRNINELHHAILGLLFSVLITAVVTDAMKDAVGRPRPDFFWRCFPDGIPKFDNITGKVECHGNKHVIREGHKSFPSGHTAWSFSGLGFLSLYLAAKVEIFDRKGHAAKLCIVFLPLLVAILVGISRVDDYWHHWQDAFAGALLGLTMATVCYRQFFPAPYDSNGVGPYTHFHVLNDAHSNQAEFADGLDIENVPYIRVGGTDTAVNRHAHEGGFVRWQKGNKQDPDINKHLLEEQRGFHQREAAFEDIESIPFSERRVHVGRAVTFDNETIDNRCNAQRFPIRCKSFGNHLTVMEAFI